MRSLQVVLHDGMTWEKFYPAGPEAFMGKLLKGLPPETSVWLEIQNENTFKVDFFHPDFMFKRVVENGRARHMNAHVNVGAQGKGISRIVNANMMDIYREKNVSRVVVDASEIGCYAWPRMGFVPLPGSWSVLSEMVGERLDFLQSHPDPDRGALPEDCVSMIRMCLQQKDPRFCWMLVDIAYSYYDQPLGRLLTLPWDRGTVPPRFPLEELRGGIGMGTFYTAEFLVGDLECRRRFEAYVDRPPGQILPKRPPRPDSLNTL